MISKETFEIFPSVDIVDGIAMTSNSAIRLTRGESSTLRRPLGTPAEVALAWQNAGAKWIHVVDLDAASGRGSNSHLIADVLAAVDINVQVCGGIRDETILRKVLATGCQRVNLGTAALENPDWCAQAIAEYGDKIAIALDVKSTSEGYQLATHGWNVSKGNLWDLLERLDKQGCQRYVVTDVERGGMMSSPNFTLLQEVCAKTSSPVIAGGGVSSLDDLRALADLSTIGVEGAILGQALHIGKVPLEDALAATQSPRR
ncbi:1-(5-phosphoribosyl)-5-((5-phosphoribosylamino)methylideneamino)imidazole-4-carboxamide isomerase [Photorhabdus laumondii subsp. laumondii]|uniref:1-(5-phosphoribosyl)-5-[(5-phosphoribosylamino)methylideneamino] imidazole-4-carboxamide isomerase 2 n=3 Tax=Photorhabdus TaxID=29487 RepID=HIS42_PHOLL|nr:MULTISPECIES: HisA/HisF-related TIM barrel protein [Photorhabdus]Q7N8D1.1 RecName: Full=1-(5-phosphoribosyl)-5-[(5-phosphoribosylamino)methylideneamino] imidazole-4-carboxamide isomerase 2; AltName: Full=Phosphoribosylformimino-5-aminoimidazole carboxamide ribotide isomerase 2 [Photorhabdus laumondii subsp. laumondii TTO1]AWK40740.1 1-(5-phosphoribosyl)-5-((5-phosphoribosylamino)methylideneamino)imidazole-4-carboxamide isomerase [Photorhabdus laumondii subsp. laumondii]AXG41549.1 1-(5-phospho